MNKQAEKDRLRPMLFEGAPDWAYHSFMDHTGRWWIRGFVLPTPNLVGMCWRVWDSERVEECKNQPETFLHWTDSLIERGDL